MGRENDPHRGAYELTATSAIPRLKRVFVETSLTHRTLGPVTQAGLVNNLNDGMLWGLLPVLLLNEGLGPERIGLIAAVYPAVWGLGQLFTGKLADHVNRRSLLIIGMVLQGVAILGLPFVHAQGAYIALSATLGLGTALVYPTFLAVLAAHTHPQQRSEAVGVFRLWRDLGYASARCSQASSPTVSASRPPSSPSARSRWAAAWWCGCACLPKGSAWSPKT